MAIHPTAIVDAGAEIDPSAEVGAYAIVEGGVRIGARSRVFPHAFVGCGTTIGCDVQVHPFAVVGHHPQDVKWTQTPSYTVIGDGCIIREHATVHRGTDPDTTTELGRRVFMMSTSHVGHNCRVGDDVVLMNSALLAGHTQVGSRAIVSGNVSVHQFCRIGELAIISGLTRVPNDVPPFMMLAPQGVVGPNVVGLRRAGYGSTERAELRAAHRLLYRSGLLFRDAVRRLADEVRTDPGRRLVAFLQAESKRGIAGYRRRARCDDDVQSIA
ncbi:MAG: acyl-ACP--UDP-N-acetylglucosamine O-acyltransferase [Planctomycetota bacterium]|nr:MAG: acyl-ACP--UDP-N-acetylglucosamine O-acyltransferase [Planctomycetota bacterium]